MKAPGTNPSGAMAIAHPHLKRGELLRRGVADLVGLERKSEPGPDGGTGEQAHDEEGQRGEQHEVQVGVEAEVQPALSQGFLKHHLLVAPASQRLPALSTELARLLEEGLAVGSDLQGQVITVVRQRDQPGQEEPGALVAEGATTPFSQSPTPTEPVHELVDDGRQSSRRLRSRRDAENERGRLPTRWQGREPLRESPAAQGTVGQTDWRGQPCRLSRTTQDEDSSRQRPPHERGELGCFL